MQTNEEATVCVYDLDFFVTVQILEDTPVVLPLGELCEDHGSSYEWTSDQKPHLAHNGEDTMQHGKSRADRSPRIINHFFQFDCKYISNIVIAGLNGGRFYFTSSNHATSKCTQSSIGRPVARFLTKQRTKNKDIDPVLGNR